jgi:hypothetical protein
LARSEQNAGARAHAPGRDRGVAAAEHASDGGPDRRAPGAARPNVPKPSTSPAGSATRPNSRR